MINQERSRALLVGSIIALVLIVVILLVLLSRSMSMSGNTAATATIMSRGVPDTLAPTIDIASTTPDATATQYAIVQQTQRAAATQTRIAEGNLFASQEAVQATAVLTTWAMQTQYYGNRTATVLASKK